MTVLHFMPAKCTDEQVQGLLLSDLTMLGPASLIWVNKKELDNLETKRISHPPRSFVVTFLYGEL